MKGISWILSISSGFTTSILTIWLAERTTQSIIYFQVFQPVLHMQAQDIKEVTQEKHGNTKGST